MYNVFINLLLLLSAPIASAEPLDALEELDKICKRGLLTEKECAEQRKSIASGYFSPGSRGCPDPNSFPLPQQKPGTVLARVNTPAENRAFLQNTLSGCLGYKPVKLANHFGSKMGTTLFI